MASIYEIEYRYDDEYLANVEPHNCYVCVYKTGTASGDTIQHALDRAGDDGDYDGVDELLGRLFGLKDEDICFYFDVATINRKRLENGAWVGEKTGWEIKLVPELQKFFSIIINDIWVERSSDV